METKQTEKRCKGSYLKYKTSGAVKPNESTSKYDELNI